MAPQSHDCRQILSHYYLFQYLHVHVRLTVWYERRLPRPRSADSTFLDEFRDVKLQVLTSIREETDKLMLAI